LLTLLLAGPALGAQVGPFPGGGSLIVALYVPNGVPE